MIKGIFFIELLTPVTLTGQTKQIMITIYVVSIDAEGSGADIVTNSMKKRDRKFEEYWTFLEENNKKGCVTIYTKNVTVAEWRKIRDYQDDFFDNVNFDEFQVLSCKKYEVI